MHPVLLSMNPFPFHGAPAAPILHWFPVLPPNPPQTTAFWDTKNVRNRLEELQDTLNLAKAMQKELETLMAMKGTEGSMEDGARESTDLYAREFYKFLEERKIDFTTQESLSLNAAETLMSKLRAQLEPFRFLIDDATPWEEKSAAARLSNKIQKSKRNNLWRKRKRKKVAEIHAKDCEVLDQADREADELRAREIARDAAQLKMEKMKEIAKLKAKEEKKRVQSELELVLIVEKLQELRSIRIQKLKKQGHFLPEEDDKFLERVRAAVEEEERQAMAAAETDAAKDAIATAEESRRTVQSSGLHSKGSCDDKDGMKESNKEISECNDNLGTGAVPAPSEEKGSDGQIQSGAYDSLANLPIEFYHYYHGSNNDIGTLIEVRRTWDAYIRPGGSRIPGHWVQPPPPADDIWASYFVRPQ